MTLKTRSFRWPFFGRDSDEPGWSSCAHGHRTTVELNPAIAAIVRQPTIASPATRIGDAAEMLRMSPYSVLPVVSPDTGELMGLASNQGIARFLLSAEVDSERILLRQRSVTEVLEPAVASVTLFDRAKSASQIMDTHGLDTLPVLDHNLQFLGLVSRSDLVVELLRPFRPPTIGGMATPNGVYLTTGVVSGGATAGALVLAGLFMFVLQQIPALIVYPIAQWLGRFAGHNPVLLGGVDLFASLATIALFFAAIRISPVAGYHAAEHQVVHAVERCEPLLIANVRAMPRVHPRCGTNLVAGVMLCTLIGGTLQPIFHAVLPSADELYLGFVLGAVVALAYWRSVGSYLQERWTTRPASDKQIAAGIRAANEVLERHGRVGFATARPLTRLWRMGLFQMVLGFIIGYALLLLAGQAFPGFNSWIKPLLLS